MEGIQVTHIQEKLDEWADRNLYVHLETTNGSYAALRGDHQMSVCAYIRNSQIRYTRGTITGTGPYRVGLKLDQGWVYATGLTDYEITSQGQLLLAGHDDEGRLAVALQLSEVPFKM